MKLFRASRREFEIEGCDDYDGRYRQLSIGGWFRLKSSERVWLQELWLGRLHIDRHPQTGRIVMVYVIPKLTAPDAGRRKSRTIYVRRGDV